LSPFRVGEGDIRFELVAGWLQIPAGWDYRDVAGIATDAEDRVYLYTRSEHKVCVHDRDGRFVASWGSGFIERAHGIAIVDGFAYLTDLSAHTVYKCTLEGELVMTLGTRGQASETGYVKDVPANLTTITRSAGPFNRPAKAMPGPNGDIYVADGYGNARVHRFSAAGELLHSWGDPGREPGQFMCVHGMWVHDDGRVFVCDRDNDRIQVFSPEGSVVAVWPDIVQPSDIRIDREGAVFIGTEHMKAGKLRMSGGTFTADRPSKVSIRDLEGREVLTWGDDDYAPGSFMSAHSLCVDSHASLYVAETPATDMAETYRPGTKVVQKFRRV
jgi:DNA-binding beta-propeller fold protein YncE